MPARASQQINLRNIFIFFVMQKEGFWKEEVDQGECFEYFKIKKKKAF